MTLIVYVIDVFGWCNRSASVHSQKEQKLTIIKKPLQGQRVLVTRTKEQAGEMCDLLKAAGASPIELPMIQIIDPRDWQPVDQALTQINGYHWCIFTSVNVVERILQRMQTLKIAPYELNAVKIATVGPQTAKALQKAGVNVDLMPERYALQYIVQTILAKAQKGSDPLRGQKFLLLRPEGGRRTMIDDLVCRGASVDEVVSHQALPCSPEDAQSQAVVDMMQKGELHAITFTGSSTVNHFSRWLQQAAPDTWQSLVDPKTPAIRPILACIGPATGDAARSYGLHVGVQATKYTAEGLVEALKQTLFQK